MFSDRYFQNNKTKWQCILLNLSLNIIGKNSGEVFCQLNIYKFYRRYFQRNMYVCMCMFF